MSSYQDGMNIGDAEADELVLHWINMLSAKEIDDFFWDYPGPYGFSTMGYGLGMTVARKIVWYRRQRGGTYSHLQQLDLIPGVGTDKINDMRIQAREAIALGAYYQLPKEPQKLYQALLAVGPGIALQMVVKKLSRQIEQLQQHAKNSQDYKINNISISLPFIALAEHSGSVCMAELCRYPRVRVEPWAFTAHVATIRRKIVIYLTPDKITKMEIER